MLMTPQALVTCIATTLRNSNNTHRLNIPDEVCSILARELAQVIVFAEEAEAHEEKAILETTGHTHR